MRKAIIDKCSENCPSARCRVPNALPPGLLGLRIIAAYDDHKRGRHDTFRKTQEESLGPQAFVVVHACCGHRDRAPCYHGKAYRATEVKPLEEVCQRDDAGKHTEVEQRRRPAQTGRRDFRWSSGGISDDFQLQVRGHPKDSRTSKNGLHHRSVSRLELPMTHYVGQRVHAMDAAEVPAGLPLSTFWTAYDERLTLS